MVIFFSYLLQLCQAKGFVCEFCGNEKDIIFPFQLSKCQRCEGEPSLLGTGLGGLRAPSLTLAWKDLKISKPRRLAKVLFLDRKQGEGGEEGLDYDVEPDTKGEEQDEESRDTAGVKQENEGILYKFSAKKLFKALLKSKGEKQEMTGWTVSDRAGETENNETEEERELNEYKNDEERRHIGREKVNLFNVFHIKKLKNSISKAEYNDGTVSESGTCSSTESLYDGGKESERRAQSKLVEFFSEKKIAKMKEKESPDVRTNEMEGEGRDDISARGQSEVKHEEFPVIKTNEEKPAFITRTNWRGHKTRKARRLPKGKKIIKGTDPDSETKGGESAEINATDTSPKTELGTRGVAVSH